MIDITSFAIDLWMDADLLNAPEAPARLNMAMRLQVFSRLWSLLHRMNGFRSSGNSDGGMIRNCTGCAETGHSLP